MTQQQELSCFKSRKQLGVLLLLLHWMLVHHRWPTTDLSSVPGSLCGTIHIPTLHEEGAAWGIYHISMTQHNLIAKAQTKTSSTKEQCVDNYAMVHLALPFTYKFTFYLSLVCVVG